MKSRIQLSDHFTYRKLLQFVLPSIVMVYNFQLLRYLGEDGVSTYGVLMYVQFIFFPSISAIRSAARPSSASTTAHRASLHFAWKNRKPS